MVLHACALAQVKKPGVIDELEDVGNPHLARAGHAVVAGGTELLAERGKLVADLNHALPVAIAEYGAENIKYWSISAAGVTGVIIPIIIIMLFVQKHFVRGLTSGALK